MPDPNYIAVPPADPTPGQPGHFDHHIWLKVSALTLDSTIKTKIDERVAAHNQLASAFDTLAGEVGLAEDSTLVGTTDEQTLTSKNINGDTNTLTNLPGIEVNDLPVANVKKEAWTSYTPTLGGGWSGGSPAITGAYQRVGNTVKVWGKITTLGSMTLTSSPTFTLPFPAHASRAWSGNAVLVDNGTAKYSGEAFIEADSTTVAIMARGTSGVHTNLTSTVPFTWVTADSISWNVEYETDAA